MIVKPTRLQRMALAVLAAYCRVLGHRWEDVNDHDRCQRCLRIRARHEEQPRA